MWGGGGEERRSQPLLPDIRRLRISDLREASPLSMPARVAPFGWGLLGFGGVEPSPRITVLIAMFRPFSSCSACHSPVPALQGIENSCSPWKTGLSPSTFWSFPLGQHFCGVATLNNTALEPGFVASSPSFCVCSHTFITFLCLSAFIWKMGIIILYRVIGRITWISICKVF